MEGVKNAKIGRGKLEKLTREMARSRRRSRSKSRGRMTRRRRRCH